MSRLEFKKVQTELMGVSYAKAQLEVRLEEILENAERIKEHIKIQEAKEIELQEKISQMEQKG